MEADCADYMLDEFEVPIQDSSVQEDAISVSDDIVAHLSALADNAVGVELWLGKILASTPFEFKDRCFRNRVTTSKYILHVRVVCPLDQDVYQYDPWSTDWLDHLGPRLMSCIIINQSKQEDHSVANLTNTFRYLMLEEKPVNPFPLDQEPGAVLYCAPSNFAGFKKPLYRRYATRK